MARRVTSDAVQPTALRIRGRLGIKTKLQLAFGVVAATTLVAAALAIVAFSGALRGVGDLTARQVPVMTDAMRLSVISAEISAAAARVVAASTPAELQAIGNTMADKRRDLEATLDRVRNFGGDSVAFARVGAAAQRLKANLEELEASVAKRGELRGSLRGQLDTLSKLHARVGEELAPVIDDAYFDVVMALRKLGRDSARAEAADPAPAKTGAKEMLQQVQQLRSALDISAQTHLVTSLLNEGAAAAEPAALVPVQDRFKAASDTLKKEMAGLTNDKAKTTIAELLQAGRPTDGVFATRAVQFDSMARMRMAIEDNAAIQAELDDAVSALVAAADSRMKNRAAGLDADLNRNRTLLIASAITSLLAAAGIGWFYVRNRLVRRLIQIAETMRRLSAGDATTQVPALADRDEIGEMARALDVLRTGEIERARLADRERLQQTERERRSGTIEAMIADFRTKATALLHDVTANIAEMDRTARSLAEIAGAADAQARAASSSSEATSSTVRNVAGSAEELGASIRQISDQASEATRVVEQASGITKTADQQIARLFDGANRIGSVVKLIRDIAEQTNLLSLNATIEAARAGEAGRGFAVVAAEVKALAGQTAKATEEIAGQVGNIQDSIGDTVEAIRSIGEVMGEISRFTAGIAAAVEQQNASTQEIALNVNHAAQGARELAGSMTSVTGAIEQTSSSAAAVLDTSRALAGQASELDRAVEEFLRHVAAA